MGGGLYLWWASFLGAETLWRHHAGERMIPMRNHPHQVQGACNVEAVGHAVLGVIVEDGSMFARPNFPDEVGLFQRFHTILWPVLFT